MKVYLGPHKNWFGPYQLVDKLFFFLSEDTREKIVDRLPAGPFEWLDKMKRERKIYVRIDGYDVWNVDSTLSHIIVPLLKEMKKQSHGAPYVYDEDVPDNLKSTSTPAQSQLELDQGIPDELHFDRWEWVVDEMIWAFEQNLTDWEHQYYSGEHDFTWEDTEDGLSEMKTGPKHTFKVDQEGIDKHRARMDNGRRLFAKYYDCLWT